MAALSAFLLLVVDTIRFLECRVVEPNPKSSPQLRTTLPYVQVSDFSLWGIHLRGPADLRLLSPNSPSTLPNYPYPAECQDGVLWLRNVRAIPVMTRRTVEFVALPTVVWLATVLFLRIWTRVAATRLDISSAACARRVALIGIARAAWIPVWLSWMGGLLVALMFLVAPYQASGLRHVLWWILKSTGECLPVVICFRALAVDRTGLFVRSRMLSALVVLPLVILVVVACIYAFRRLAMALYLGQ
jgi:hypothetical protein